ncbi:MAG: hypothetical protein DVB28_001895 [Verrucomicrobia bacterium]|nr:MAG: hypothetical protein DVB28_001895 [Verrucomicrobiota bacterium]
MTGFNRRIAARNRPTNTTSPNDFILGEGRGEGVAQFPEPFKGGVFNVGFGEVHCVLHLRKHVAENKRVAKLSDLNRFSI